MHGSSEEVEGCLSKQLGAKVSATHSLPFAKVRPADVVTIGDGEVPTFRGHALNDSGCSSRTDGTDESCIRR